MSSFQSPTVSRVFARYRELCRRHDRRPYTLAVDQLEELERLDPWAVDVVADLIRVLVKDRRRNKAPHEAA